MSTKNLKKTKKEVSQAGIAGRLKAITLAVALIGGAFFFLCGRYMFVNEKFGTVSGISREAALVLLVITAVLCYAALWQFWKVCREIGHDNSFSVENYLAFRIIGLVFLVLGVVWILFTAVCLWMFEHVAVFALLVLGGMTFIWLGVAAVSATLAMLIDKARQIREENDYTI